MPTFETFVVELDGFLGGIQSGRDLSQLEEKVGEVVVRFPRIGSESDGVGEMLESVVVIRRPCFQVGVCSIVVSRSSRVQRERVLTNGCKSTETDTQSSFDFRFDRLVLQQSLHLPLVEYLPRPLRQRHTALRIVEILAQHSTSKQRGADEIPIRIQITSLISTLLLNLFLAIHLPDRSESTQILRDLGGVGFSRFVEELDVELESFPSLQIVRLSGEHSNQMTQ